MFTLISMIATAIAGYELKQFAFVERSKSGLSFDFLQSIAKNIQKYLLTNPLVEFCSDLIIF